MGTRTIKTGKLFRTATFDRAAVNADARTVELSFSSEAPVERWFGIEVLDHDPASVDMSRMSAGAPLLLDHDTRKQIGVIEECSVGGDRVGRAKVRFGKSAQAEEIYQDVLDGIRSSVSVGYQIKDMRPDGKQDNVEVFRATRWMPYEVSLVSVPADISVGVGRAADGEDEICITEPDAPADEEAAPVIITETRSIQMTDLNKSAGEILALARRHNMLDAAQEFISNGKSVDEFRAYVLANLPAPVAAPTGEIGMTQKESRDFSFIRLIAALADRDWTNAGLERAACEAAAKALGRTARGAIIPMDVLTRASQQVKGTAGDGGYLVATELKSDSFIAALQNALVVRGLGARVFEGLVGDVAFPKETGAAAVTWLAEDGSAADTKMTFAQVPLSPKTVAAKSSISRRLLLQSSLSVEALVQASIRNAVAEALDKVALIGGGTNEPAGLISTLSGGQIIAIGATGGAATWAKIVEMETKIATSNANVGSMGYAINAKTRGHLKSTLKAASTAVFLMDEGGMLNGYKTATTNILPSNLTKSSGSGLSAMLFGNWADLYIGLWSGLDVQVDPYTLGDTGAVLVRAFQDADVAIARTESFTVCKDVAA